MYKIIKAHKNSFKINTSTTGESIEAKLRRMKKTNEPIKDVSDIIYTERKDGVKPEYDIRTDKMEIAVQTMDNAATSKRLNRGKGLTAKEKEFEEKANSKQQNEPKNDGGAEPVQAT